jgi:hypothetical protein
LSNLAKIWNPSFSQLTNRELDKTLLTAIKEFNNQRTRIFLTTTDQSGRNSPRSEKTDIKQPKSGRTTLRACGNNLDASIRKLGINLSQPHLLTKKTKEYSTQVHIHVETYNHKESFNLKEPKSRPII